MNIRLWEWNLNIVVIESVIDAFENSAIIGKLRIYTNPDDDFEDKGGIAKFLQDDVHALFLVDAIELRESLDEHLLTFCHICAISHTNIEDMALPTMITSEILIVLCKELGIGESNNRTIHGSNHSAGIGNTRYSTSHAIADDKVANLYTSRHQRDAIIDVFQKVLRCEADTCRKTSRDDDEPLVADIEDGKAGKEPDAIDENLENILHHHYAGRC